MWADLTAHSCPDAQTAKDDEERIRSLEYMACWLQGPALVKTAPADRDFGAESLRERAEDLRRQVIDYDDPDPPELEPKVEADAIEVVADWLEALRT